jgi:hypothetical protein
MKIILMKNTHMLEKINKKVTVQQFKNLNNLFII